ncbi:MAG: hypothetical protein AB7J13_12120, partial [Pyrinomonadaceae bacterium]
MSTFQLRRFTRVAATITFVFISWVGAAAQSVVQTVIPPKLVFLPPTVEHRVGHDKLKSKLMAREMPYRLILPAAYYKDQTARFP